MHEIQPTDVTVQMAPGKFDDTYGEDYLKWKLWEGGEFGEINKEKRVYYDAEIHRSKRKFAKGSKVLEIGFGSGNFLKYASDNQWDICGLEINELLVKSAKSKGYNAIHSDNLSMFPNESFDLIVAFDVFEHIPKDALLGMVLEVKRVLNEDGIFIVRCPNGDSPFGLINQNGDITHATVIGSGVLRYLATKSNMCITFIGGEAQTLFGRSWLHFLHRAISLPIIYIFNLIINLVFYSRTDIAFCSSNLIVIYKNGDLISKRKTAI